MAELDKIPTKAQIEIETVKLDESIFQKIIDLNAEVNKCVSQYGEIYIRRKELTEEFARLDELTKVNDDDFKAKNAELREVLDGVDEKYPQGRINMQDGTVQYQPGAPTRKQLREQQTPKQ
jgi:hypothetical protein